MIVGELFGPIIGDGCPPLSQAAVVSIDLSDDKSRMDIRLFPSALIPKEPLWKAAAALEEKLHLEKVNFFLKYDKALFYSGVSAPAGVGGAPQRGAGQRLF